MLGRLTVALALFFVALAAGCGGSTSSEPTTTAPPRIPPPASTEQSKPSDALTGFGASEEAWDEHHKEDPRFGPGSSYDPDSSLGDGERFNDRYYAVQRDEQGRVFTYSMRFPSGTSVAEAKQLLVSGEFPKDAKIAWFKAKGICAQMYVQSKAVSRAVGSGALVSFSSGDAGDHYEPNSVTGANLVALPVLGKGIGC